MSLDTQHTEKSARAQCEELERQAKQLLSIGYKLNELEIVSFQSDGRKEVWPKSLVNFLPPLPIVFKDFFIPDSEVPFEMKTKAGQAAARAKSKELKDQILGKHNLPKPPLLIEQLKWSKQVPWVSGWWWCRSSQVSDPIATVMEVRTDYGLDGESDLISLQYRSTNGDWYEADYTWEWAGPIPEPIN